MSARSIFSSWVRSLTKSLSKRTRRQKPSGTRRPNLGVEQLEKRWLLSSDLHFDFGTLASPAAANYTPVSLLPYDAARGYGWSDINGIAEVDRGTEDPLTRDFHQGVNGTFMVDVANGTYEVTATLGDAAALHDRQTIWVEGFLVAFWLRTDTNQFIRPKFRTKVSDGQLTFRIADMGGSTAYFALNALDIHLVPSTGAPIANAGGSQTANEGSALQLNGSVRQGDAPFAYGWNFGDGGTASGTLTPSHIYGDNGVYTATLTVTDAFGRSSQSSATVTVNGVAPTATLGNGGAVDEGSSGTVSFSNQSDSSAADVAAGFLYSFDFNNDGVFEVSTSISRSATVPSTYLLDGPTSRIIRGRIKDKDGAFRDYVTSIVVNNVAPRAILNNGGAVTEGGTGSVSFFAPDDSIMDSTAGFKYSFDFGNDGTFEITDSASGSATVPGSYLVDGPVNRVIRGRIKDKDGAFTDYTTTIAVTNLAPMATLNNGGAVNEGSSASVTVSGQVDSPRDLSAGLLSSYDFNNDGNFEIVDNTSASATVPASFIADGPGSRVVRVRVKDKDGDFRDYTTSIPVNNTAPTAVLSNSGPVNQGSSTTVSFSSQADAATDLGAGFRYSFDFDNDGVFEVTDSPSAGATVPASYLANGPGTRTVRGRIKDKDGAFTDYTTAITIFVDNGVPTATFTNGGPVVEGTTTTVSFSGQLSSQGATGGSFHYSYDFANNGSFDVTDSPLASMAVPAQYLADGPAAFSVRGRIRDSRGAFSDYVTIITVNSSAPTATFSNSGTVSEGSAGAVSFSGLADVSSADVAAGFRFSFDFDNDGSFEITGANSALASVPAAFLGDGPGSRTIRGRIADKDGAFTDYLTRISVTNAAPTATLGNSGTVTEGSTGTVSFSGQADSASDLAAGFLYSFDFNNDGTFEVTDSGSSQATVSASFIGDGPATRTIRGRIKDKDGAFTDYTTPITVANGAPTASLNNGGTVSEGTAGSVSFSGQTDSAADLGAGFRYSFDFNNDGSFEITDGTSAAATVPSSFLSDGPGSQTIRGRIKDRDGAFTDYTTTLAITNVAPLATLGNNGPVGVGGTALVTFTGQIDSATDLTAGFRYSYDFNNDGSFELTDGNSASATVPSLYLSAGPGVQTVRGRIKDKDGAFTDYTTSITIYDASPPTATLSNSGPVLEGSTAVVSFSGQASPAGTSGSYQYSYDFNNDGVFEITDTAAEWATVPASYLADGPASRLVRARIKDSRGTFSDYVTSITVTGAAPTVTFSNSGAVNEGNTGTVSFSNPADASPTDVAAGFRYSVDFNNDGLFEITDSAANLATVPASFLADGPSTRTIRGRIKDKDGAFTDYTTVITVNNTAPTGTLGNGGSVNEGLTGTVSFSGQADSTADLASGLRYSFDFNNDGTFEVVDGTSAAATVPASYLPDGPSTRTVKGRIKDKDGAFTDYTTTLTVNNTAPTATLGNNSPVPQGSTATVSFSGQADASADTSAGFRYSFDFDNDGIFEVSDGTSASATVPASYLSGTSRLVKGRIKDKDGAFSDYTTTITITTNNTAPTATFANGGAVNEGSTGTVSFTNQADSPADVVAGFRYSFDFDNNGTFEVTDSSAASATVPASYLTDGPASRTVRGRIKDQGGAFTDYTTSITVNNLAPSAALSNSGAINEGGTASVYFLAPTDSSSADVAAGFRYSFDFDNDGTFEVTDGTSAAATVPASYLADGPGTRTIKGRVKDKDGAFADYTTAIPISNVAPTATLSNNGPISQGSTAMVSFSGPADVAADVVAGFRYSFDFDNDGTFEVTDGTSASATVPASYLTGTSRTVKGRIKDKDGAFTDYTTTITVSTSSQSFPNNLTPPALPAPTGPVVRVSTLSQLQNAVANLQSGQTILIDPGTYDLPGSLYLPQNRTNVAIRGATGNSDEVVIRGGGMNGTVDYGFWTGNVQGVTFADMTIRDMSLHGIILNAGTESPLIHNVHMIDIGDQMVKSNPDGAGGGVDNGILEYSVFEYSAGWAPDYYIAGIDVHTGKNWQVRYNTFKNFRLPANSGQPTTHPVVLLWNDTEQSSVTWNTFINNDRDISLGLYNFAQGNTALADQRDGRIEGNLIYRDAATAGDVAIFVSGPNTKVYHNTYYDASGAYPNAIEYRFAITTNVDIKNNLVNRAISARDGATASLGGNVTTAQSSWFKNPAIGDLRLAAAASLAIDKGVVLANPLPDYDGTARDALPDVGADEYAAGGASDTTPPTVALSSPASGASVSGTIAVSANASDNVGVVGVQFLMDGAAWGTEDTAAPYSISWNTSGVAAGSHTLSARARDAAGNQTTSSVVTVTVTAAGPALSANAGLDKTGNEGASVSFVGTTSGGTAPLTFSWTFGDGGTASGALSSSHTYADNGTYTVTLTVTDALGQTNSDTAVVTVNNVAPTGTLANAGAVNEGSTGNVSFSSPSDPSSADVTAGFRYSFDFDNNGTFEVADGTSASATVPASYLADGPSTRTVKGRIKDKDGAFTDYTTNITVNNVAPTATLGNNGPVAQGSTATVSFSGQVDVAADVSGGFRYSFDFDNDGTFEVTDGTPASATVPASYLTGTSRTVKGRIKDKDGAFTDYTTTITITTATNTAPTATFGNSGAVAEGSTGTVSFSNQADSPADVTAGFRYSYDFDNNGTFEITDNASASATVPASYLADGPASRTVRGRIKDQSGAFTDYTSAITVNNVAPTVNPGGPYPGLINTAIAFASSATDPSTADTAAGLTYTWNFGDGGTGTGASLTHTYAAAGTYTVSLSVRDKDNATTTVNTTATVTSSTGNQQYLQVGNDKIPNFGANPTISTARTGLWSDPATWSLGRLPALNDVVSINANHIVTYDVISDVALNTVAIQLGGKLQFKETVSTRLTVQNFLVMPGGELQVGTAANPIPASLKAEIVFANLPLDTVNDPEQYGNGLIGLGKIVMHGAVRSDTFVRLAVEPKAGDTTLTLSQPVTGWLAGDKLLLPDSRQMDNTGTYSPQWELPTIASVSANGLVVTLSQALAYAHPGARNAAGVLEYLPHVGITTRSVVVRSQSATGTRGHTMFLGRADVDIRYTSFGGLGRTTNQLFDDTTFNAQGAVTHLGTNQHGRYPVHFNDLYGPTVAPANNYQYTFIGNAVTCPLDPMPFRSGITLSNSHYGLDKDNVLYNWAGAGLVAETGSESYNVIAHNFIVKVEGNSDKSTLGQAGDGFWFHGTKNYVRNNVATDISPRGAVDHPFGFNYFVRGTGVVKIPAFRGADTTVAGQSVSTDMNLTPILEFSSNEIYGVSPGGLSLWWIGTDGSWGTINQSMPESVIKDFTAWHFHARAIYVYPTNHLTIDHLVARGDVFWLGDPHYYVGGIVYNDYHSFDLVVKNSDIQGVRWGIFAPARAGAQYTIKDTYLRNLIDIQVGTIWGVDGGPSLTVPRKTVIQNVRFDPVPGLTHTAIEMYFEVGDKHNLVLRDEVFVYDYDGVANDNFRLYYLEQAANFIVPQSFARTVGSPVAGLTNQQTWSTYGIAIAGAISPTSQRRSELIGFVDPF